MHAMRFAGPFGFLLLIPVLYAVSPMATLSVPLSVILALLALERMGRKRKVAVAQVYTFRLLPPLYILLQLAVTIWAAVVITQPQSSLSTFASVATSVGACGGVFGMLGAHELIHRRSPEERRLGMLMLFAMSYPQFRIAHVHGHHRHAGTAQDASTARLGESFYHFLLRTIAAQLSIAWRFEGQRTRGKGAALLRNRVIQGGVFLASAYAGLLFLAPKAAAFLAAESAIAIIVLELFNYIAHYGLVRRASTGRLEPLGPHHSWNSSGVGNYLIFNMGHHSHHHTAPTRSFEGLTPAEGARELPAGYAGSILLALIQPLWRKVMDHRIAPIEAKRAESIYKGDRGPATIIP